MINAPLLAKAAGVQACHNTADDGHSVTVTVSGEKDSRVSMTGCICGDKTFLTGNTVTSIQ